MLSVRDFGAIGDGQSHPLGGKFSTLVLAQAVYPHATKLNDEIDWAAIQAAVNVAIAQNASLIFPGGTYKTSKYIDVFGARELQIIGQNATIRYPSDDTSLVADSIANSNAQARSGFLLRYCVDVKITGLLFQGGTAQEITFTNVGCGVAATHCVGTYVQCNALDGNAIFIQDAMTNTNRTGDSLTVAGGVVTLACAANEFTPGHVKRRVTIANAANPVNNGTFLLDSYVSAGAITFTNAAGISEVTAALTWSINDADSGTVLNACETYGCRGAAYTGPNAKIVVCHFERPANADVTGIGDAFSVAGTTVTLTDANAQVTTQLVGKYVLIAGAATPANDGLYKITGVVPGTQCLPAQIIYTNAAGVAEAFTGTWWIMSGDKTGIGAGAGALVFAAGTMTLTSSTPAFSTSDQFKVIRIANATTAANNGHFVIQSVPSPTQVTYTNVAGVSEEAFAQGWAIDAYDNGHDSGNTYGSTHAIYLFAGRYNIVIDHCTFIGVRTTCVKISGSTVPIHDIEVTSCYALECGQFIAAGADDSQQHTDITISNNDLVNVANGRNGWNEQLAILVVGSRNVNVSNNKFFYAQNAISSVGGRNTVSGWYGIFAGRYLAGVSQPVEGVQIEGNQFSADPQQTSAASICQSAIHVESVGLVAKHRTGGTLTTNGTTMTLSDLVAVFSQQEVGASLQIVNAPDAGNNGTFTVLSVSGSRTLAYANAGGVGGGVSAGTYRIQPTKRGGACRVVGNQIQNVGSSAIDSQKNVGPEIIGNIINGSGGINCIGDLAPRIVGNRWIGINTTTALLRIHGGTSWPFVDDNLITGAGNMFSSSAAIRSDVGIGGDNGTRVDYPLLGKRGRVRPTQAQEEMVITYGSGHVDGDSIRVSGTTYTYKATASAGNQFNSFAGLVALIDAQAGLDCSDYGTGYAAGNVTTQHLRIRRNVRSVTDGNAFIDRINVLNPIALVVPRNNTGGGEAYLSSRGSGSAGPTADKFVVWSLECTFAGGVMVWPDNASGQTLLQAHGWRPIKNANDAGCCEVIAVTPGATAGTEELRWVIV